MRLSSALRSLCLPLPLLVACPGDDGPSTSATTSATTSDASTTTQPPGTEDTTVSPTGTTTTSDTETDGVLPGCECIVDEVPGNPNSGPDAPTCGDSICPLVSAGCGKEFCDFGPFALDDPAALECALTALRDRTPGLVTWSYEEGGGFITQDGYLLIAEDETVVWRDWIREDLNFNVSDAVLGQLPPPAIYEACLADPSDLARFNCLADPLETQLGLCDAGWECIECI